MNPSYAKYLAWFGCFVLVLTALLHTTGFSEASKVANIDGTNTFVAFFIEPLWLLPVWNWLIVSLLAGILTIKQHRQNAILLTIISLIPLANAATLFIFTGPFVGGFALLIAGSLFATSGFMSLREVNQSLSDKK